MSYQNRQEIPEQYKWNLSDIFATPADWETAFGKFVEIIPSLGQYKGKLSNIDTVLDYYKQSTALEESVGRLYCYAYMSYCEDTKSIEALTRFGKLRATLSKMTEILAYVEPELTALSDEQLKTMAADPRFADYDVAIERIIRNKSHVLSEPEEKLLAGMGIVTNTFSEIFNRLNNGEQDYGTIEVDGKEVKLTHGLYSSFLQHPDQKIRKAAFETYYKAYVNQINTLAGIYEGSVQSDCFYAKAYKFNSAMESALFHENVDKKVYENLIGSINKSFKPLHEYIALRKQILGLETLNMYDLYVPMFENAEISVDFDKAYDIVVEGLAPLGKDYQKLLKDAKESRWIDVYETPTKNSGAYSMGVYGVHPYVQLNYQQNTHDVFTIAHEMGHSLHTYYSEKNQPAPKADYTIFVAEVASTCNEVLLLNYLLGKEKDVNIRKYLLSYYLDMLRTTMYRQAMFAEFEYITHQKCENGEPLSFKTMCDEYYALNKKYYGESVEHNKEIAYEWSRIPHFYRAFYVYKYSTGITSAVCIAQKILKEGAPMVEKYKKFLSLGCSTDPVSELKTAGVDLTTTEPFEIVAKSFTETLTQLKELI